MKITLEDDNGVYSVETRQEGHTIHEYFEHLIIPVLNAAGFSGEMIDRYINE